MMAAVVLSPADVMRVVQALYDAAHYREDHGSECRDCERAYAENQGIYCDDHQGDEDQAQAYRRILVALGQDA